MGTRTREHMANVRLAKTQSSALAEHATKEGHSISWDNGKILASKPSWIKRRWTEAWQIAKNKDALFKVAHYSFFQTAPHIFIWRNGQLNAHQLTWF